MQIVETKTPPGVVLRGTKTERVRRHNDPVPIENHQVQFVVERFVIAGTASRFWIFRNSVVEAA